MSRWCSTRSAPPWTKVEGGSRLLGVISLPHYPPLDQGICQWLSTTVSLFFTTPHIHTYQGISHLRPSGRASSKTSSPLIRMPPSEEMALCCLGGAGERGGLRCAVRRHMISVFKERERVTGRLGPTNVSRLTCVLLHRTAAVRQPQHQLWQR